MQKKLNKLRASVKEKRPLIHCITNPISINQCANAVLAVGARPIMAENPNEVEEIAESASALLINLGNITDARMNAMEKALCVSRSAYIPAVLDAVGVACSKYRRLFANKLIGQGEFSVIKGNYSEITALYDPSYKSSGVDADGKADAESVKNISAELALKYNCIILATGKTDIITDGKKTVLVKNGSPRLADITGMGCMLGAIIACFLSVEKGINAVVTACVLLGISGSLAENADGCGSYFVSLMDRLSTLTAEELENNIDIEVYER